MLVTTQTLQDQWLLLGLALRVTTVQRDLLRPSKWPVPLVLSGLSDSEVGQKIVLSAPLGIIAQRKEQRSLSNARRDFTALLGRFNLNRALKGPLVMTQA
jgi:hypothetical protein